MGHPYRRSRRRYGSNSGSGWPQPDVRLMAGTTHGPRCRPRPQSVFVIASRARRHNPWSSRKPSPVAAASALPALLAEFLALGAFTGFLAGLLGIGGGMLMVPFVTFIIASRGSRVRPRGEDGHRHLDGHHPVHLDLQPARASQRGAVRWDLVRGIAPGIVIGFAGRRRGRVRAHQGRSAGRAVRGIRRLLGHTDAAQPQAQALARHPGGASARGAAGAGIGFLSGWSAPAGLRVGALHDLVRRAHPQRRGHQRGARLPDRAGQHRGLRDQRLEPARRIAGSLGYLYLPALLCIAVASVSTAPLGHAWRIAWT